MLHFSKAKSFMQVETDLIFGSNACDDAMQIARTGLVHDRAHKRGAHAASSRGRMHVNRVFDGILVRWPRAERTVRREPRTRPRRAPGAPLSVWRQTTRNAFGVCEVCNRKRPSCARSHRCKFRGLMRGPHRLRRESSRLASLTPLPLSPPRPQCLHEPVMRVGFVVERLHFAVAATAIQGLRFFERPIGVESQLA